MVVTIDGGTLNVCTKITKLWHLVDVFLSDKLGSPSPRSRCEGLHGETPVLNHRLSSFLYKDLNLPNVLMVRCTTSYIQNLHKNKSFGVRYICQEGEWYIIRNLGAIDNDKHQRWWAIEILKAGKLPMEILNCEKTKDGNAECWYNTVD